MTVTISVYEKGERINSHMALGKSMKVVNDYLDDNLIPHEKGKEHDDVKKYTRDTDEKIILIDDTNVLGVDGGMANFVSEYWIKYDENIWHGLIEALK